MCVSGLNPYLTLNTANSGTVLIDLASDDKEFQSVEEEVAARPLHHSHSDWLMVIQCLCYRTGYMAILAGHWLSLKSRRVILSLRS